MLRPWDNVPRKALAKEISSNILVYANYLQNYNLTFNGNEIIPKVITNYKTKNQNNTLSYNDLSQGGLKSVKSQRNYHIGVVYGDKYGRETPVNENVGRVSIPWFNKDRG